MRKGRPQDKGVAGGRRKAHEGLGLRAREQSSNRRPLRQIGD